MEIIKQMQLDVNQGIKLKFRPAKKRNIGDYASSDLGVNEDNKINDKANNKPEENSPDPANSDLDIERNNNKEKPAQEPEKNLDLIRGVDDWAASPAPGIFF